MHSCHDELTIEVEKGGEWRMGEELGLESHHYPKSTFSVTSS
jgi:hypothetical protein